MPTPAGAPAIEFGCLYSTGDVTVALTTDAWGTVLHASDISSQALNTAADNATGLITVGKGTWEFDGSILMEAATTTDDIHCRVLVTAPDATTSTPGNVVPILTVDAGADGAWAHVKGFAEDVAKDSTFAFQVLNNTVGDRDIVVSSFCFKVKGIKTFAAARVKTSAT